MNYQANLQVLESKLQAVLSKKVELDDIPRFAECRVDVLMLCSEAWFDLYYDLQKQLESSIAFVKSQILLEQMLSLDVDQI
jgi:hypothetical protein